MVASRIGKFISFTCNWWKMSSPGRQPSVAAHEQSGTYVPLTVLPSWGTVFTHPARAVSTAKFQWAERDKRVGRRPSPPLKPGPGGGSHHLCSHSVNENLITGPYPTPRKTRKSVLPEVGTRPERKRKGILMNNSLLLPHTYRLLSIM